MKRNQNKIDSFMLLTPIYLFIIQIFCFKRAFRNLGRKIENSARSLVGKDNKFNPYKRGFTNSKEKGAKLLEELYDYNKTKRKTERFNDELQKLASKGDINIDNYDVNKNLFKKIGEDDDSLNISNILNGVSNNINTVSDNINIEDERDDNEYCDLAMNNILNNDYNNEDELNNLITRKNNRDSIEIFPGDQIIKKEIITISRRI